MLVLTPTARPLEALATALEPRPARALEELTREALAPTTPLVGTVKIVSVLSRTGLTKTIRDQIINAYRMALEEHNQQVGNAALNDRDVLVYLGPSLSSAARVAIPILCKAQMAIISPTATYPGLTKQTPFNLAGEPDVYYPGCQRNFARVVPTDDQQGAVGAAFAQQLGVHNVYVLHDGSIYGQAIAAVFASSAKQIGLQVVGGQEDMDPSAADYHDLAERVHESNPDLVYFGGIDANHAGKLWQDLRAALDPDVSLMGADGINENAFIDAAGAAAEGTYATFPGVPAPKLTGKGANWYQRYIQKFGETPQPYVAYAYEAMNVALDAITRAGVKDRAAVRDAILATRSYDGVLGPLVAYLNRRHHSSNDDGSPGTQRRVGSNHSADHQWALNRRRRCPRT